MNNLLKPIKKFGIKNRLVLAPMTRCLCDKNGIPSKKMENYYIKQAKSGFGLIIIESAAINSNDALGYKNGLQFHSEKHLKYWSVFLKKLKKYNCKIIIQLFHAGRLTVKEITGGKVFGPSAIKSYNQTSFWRIIKNGKICHFQTNTEFKKPAEVSKKRIQIILKQFENSCKLAMKARFDGIEIHGAHGYLVHSFNTYYTNKRKDYYKYSNFQFTKSLVKRCKKIIKNKILSFRLSVHMVDNYLIKYSKKQFNFKKLVFILDKLGVNIFHCSEIKFKNKILNHNRSLFEEIRTKTKKTIITCGGILDFKFANKCLNEGANLIAFGRLALINVNFLDKLKNNKKLKNRFNYKLWQKL